MNNGVDKGLYKRSRRGIHEGMFWVEMPQRKKYNLTGIWKRKKGVFKKPGRDSSGMLLLLLLLFTFFYYRKF
jgi:hypothetical protein